MDQDIGGHFSKDGVANADSHISLKIKRVGQMFRHEGHDPLIALNEICTDQITIIVPVEIDLAQDQIGTVMGHRREDNLIFT